MIFSNKKAARFLFTLIFYLYLVLIPSLVFAQSPSVKISPREITTQPFTFSFTLSDPNTLLDISSFSFLLNDADITDVILQSISQIPGLVAANNTFTEITITFANIMLPPGTFKITINLADRAGNRGTDTVTLVSVSPGPIVSLSKDIQPIFNNSCAFTGCHAGRNPEPQPGPGMSLEAANIFQNTPGADNNGIVGVTSTQAPRLLRVNSGNSSASYIINKLENTHLAVGGSGQRMPLALPPLPPQQIQLIKDWIDQGAQNN